MSNSDGTFTATFDLDVENTGNELITGVQITDDLSDFPGALVVVLASGELTTSYDAATGTLLSGSDQLAVNGLATVEIQVTFTPDRVGPFTNNASVSGTGSATASTLTDTASADANPVLDPQIEVSKDVKSVVVAADGSGQVTSVIEFLVRNVGNETLVGVQLTDALGVAPNNFTNVVSATASNGMNLSENSSYNGGSVIELLTGADTLTVGQAGTVELTIVYIPVQGQETYLNQGTASGVGEVSGGSDSEVSDNPDTPDEDNDASENAPPFEPELEITKTLSDLVNNGGGSFTANFTIVVESTGTETVTNVQVNDDIATIFPANATYVATSTDLSVVSPNTSNGDLLTGSDSLNVGQTGTINLSVTFDADGNDPYLNQANASGVGLTTGDPDFDISDDPTTPLDPEDPTVVELDFSPVLDFDKVASPLVDNSDGTFTAVYTFTLTNNGDEPIANVQVSDALTNFPANSVASLVSTDFTANLTPFDGSTQPNLLSGNDVLAIGETGEAQISVTFTPTDANAIPNVATASGAGEFGEGAVSEVSDATVTPSLTPSLEVTKTFDNVIDNEDGTFTAFFNISVANTGNEALENVVLSDSFSNFPADAVPDVSALASITTLAVDESQLVSVSVTFTPSSASAITNVAEASADGVASGTGVTDSGSDAVTPPLAPAFEVTKEFVQVDDLGDGSFAATFEITATNTGNEAITGFGLVEDLSDFPAGSTIVESLPTNVTLGVDEVITETVVITFVPDADRLYTNTVNANGSAFSGPITGNATADVDPPLAPAIEVTKTATGVTSQGGGTYLATFDIVVANTGNELLTGVTVTDDLSGFPAGSTLGGDALPVNATFAVNQTETYQITVSFTADSAGPFTNVAEVEATSGAGNAPVADDSGTATETNPPFAPSATFVKQARPLVDNLDGSFTAIYDITITNTGNEALALVQVTEDFSDFPSNATATVMSTDFTALYDAATGTLLTGNDILPIAATGVVTVTVEFEPDRTGTFTNNASLDTEGQFSQLPVTGSGSDAVEPVLDPQIEISKDVKMVSVDDGPGGSGEVTSVIEILVRNVGNEPLVGVQVIDDLAASPNNFTDVVSASVSGGMGLTINPSYDGSGDINLLDGADTLAVGAAGTVELTIVYRPVAGQTSYLNQATASGTGEFSLGTDSEVSDNPDTPGADNDASENAPPFEPELEITKTLTNVVDNGGGSFTAFFDLLVVNTGNEDLLNVQVVDDIEANFPVGVTSLATSADFDVVANTGSLLDGNDELTVGSSGLVQLEVTFAADGNDPYTNQASVSGAGEVSGAPDFDISDDPTTADPEDATLVELMFTGGITITKALNGTLVDNADGTFTAVYDLTVSNTGTQPIVNLQIVDDLSEFPSDANVSVSATNLTTNANPAGGSLLTGNDTLAIGGSELVTLTVVFTPENDDRIGNTAQATGQGEFDDAPVSDDSGLPVFVDPVLIPSLVFAKELVDPVEDLGSGVFRATYNFTVTNNGNEALTGVVISDTLSDFPAGTTSVVVGDPLAIGDLAVNEVVTRQIQVTFTADANQPYDNQALVTGTGDVSGDPIAVLSDDPVLPGVSDPTETVPPLAPSVVITKTAGTISSNGDGSFLANFTIDLENTGNEPLTNLEVLDDLSSFPNLVSASVTGSTNIVTNLSYDGSNPVVESGSLGIDMMASVTIAVTFVPDGPQAVANNVSVTGDGAFSGGPASDDNDLPAEVTPEFTPAFDLEKDFVAITDIGGGAFRADYTITVTNTGDEPLSNIAISDPLTGFPAPAVLSGDALPTALDLAIDAFESYDISVTFTPDSDLPYANQAELTGEGGTSGTPIDGVSDNPATLAAEDPTLVQPPLTQSIMIAKSLIGSTSLGNDRFSATYEIAVTNTGNQPVNELQIIDDLSDFGAGVMVTLSSTELTTSYNAVTGELLTGTDVLAVDETRSLQITVEFTRTRVGAYLNSATADGAGQFTDIAVDDATDEAVPFTPENQKAGTYDEFVTEFGLTGTNDDQDIYSNAFEFATCLDPTDGQNKKAFCFDYNAAEGRFDANYLRRSPIPAGVTYTLEGLDDLRNSPAGWTALSDIAIVGPDPSGNLDAEQVIYEGITENFVRLKVEVDTGAGGVVTSYSQVFGQKVQAFDPECQTFSDPFVDKECYSGTILSQVGDVLEVSSDVVLPDAGPFYIEMLSGTYEGHRFEVDVANTSGSSLALRTESTNSLAPIPSDLDGMIALRRHRTLDDLAAPALFVGDNDPLVGDDETRALVFIDGVWMTFFVENTAPQQWTDIGDSTGADAGGLIIDPCLGIFLHSKAGPVSVPTAGVVRQWDVACPLDAGYNLIGSVYPIDETPDDRDMRNGFTGTGDPGTADQVNFWRGDLGIQQEGYDSHFYALLGADIDQWAAQADSSLDSENAVELFPSHRASFYDKINPQLWIRPLTWTP